MVILTYRLHHENYLLFGFLSIKNGILGRINIGGLDI